METVVLVHGLWMNGREMGLLGRRLRGCGFAPLRFAYAEVRHGLEDNARRLNAWLAGVPGERVHFVAHSLGGILLLHLFERFPAQRPGRVVFLASPVAGSAVARRLARLAPLSAAFGGSLERGLNGDGPSWQGERDLGVVAGSYPLGMGWVAGGLQPPHDGTVSEQETRLAGASDRVLLPVSHFGMLVSRTVARQVCSFLRTGGFQA